MESTLPSGCPLSHSGRSIAGPYEIRFSRYLPHCAAGRHAHPEGRVVFPLKGYFETQYGRDNISVGPGHAFYRPPGDAHTDRYSGRMDCLTLVLPRDGAIAAMPLLLGDAALLRAALVLRAEGQMRDAASAMIVEAMAALLCVRLLHKVPVGERGRPAWIAIVRDRLHDTRGAAPSLQALASLVGRNPAHIAAIFKRAYGMSVGIYSRRLKLWQARDAIDADPSADLAEIALSTGFADQSHFIRHFRRLFKVTPGAYRARHFARQASSQVA